MHDLAEVIEKNKEIKELKEKLTECFKGELSAKGAAGMDAQEAGEVVDMIKDLAETEKYCMEALYYQKVVEAMTSYDEPRYGESIGYNGGSGRGSNGTGSMGYNNNRYASGRYAPAGHGNMTSMGYMPMDMAPNNWEWNDQMAGYSGSNGGNSGGNNSGSNGNSNGGSVNGGGRSGYNDYRMSDDDPQYGKAYNEFRRRRKYYTATNSPEDKREMELNAEEHIHTCVATMRDIWKDADMALKKRMKDSLTELMKDMTV